VETLRAAGGERFVELGPGRVLSGLVRRIDRAAETAAVDFVAKLRERGPPVDAQLLVAWAICSIGGLISRAEGFERRDRGNLTKV
jgi:acyl transferase domain-containing protein